MNAQLGADLAQCPALGVEVDRTQNVDGATVMANLSRDDQIWTMGNLRRR